jgi:hypothetical protein
LWRDSHERRLTPTASLVRYTLATLAIGAEIMRVAVTLILICCLAACDGAKYRQSQTRANPVEDGDFSLLAEAGFKQIDPHGEIKTFLIATKMDPRAREALKRIAKILPQNQAEQIGECAVPEGTFIVREFSIEDGVATIDGTLGPVTCKMTAANLPDCGKNFTMQFFLQGLDWVNPSYKIRTCEQRRNWTPIDAAPQ